MSNYGKRISIKKRLTGIVVDLKKIPLHKQENVFLRDGYYVIGHKDMYSHCNKCKKWYHQENFGLSHQDSYGRRKIRNTCKECISANNKVVWSIKNFPNLPAKPDKCPICLNADKPLELDHCHVNKKFRGWICKTCNSASGRFGDDVEIIKRLLNYHLEFNKKMQN